MLTQKEFLRHEKNFYVKTDSVSSTPELQDACLAEDAILENVYVSPEGK